MKKSLLRARSFPMAIGVAVLLVAVTAGPTAARERPGPDDDAITLSDLQQLDSTSVLDGQGQGLAERPNGIVTMGTVLTGNPNGCYGQTDNPHRSGGDASVHARTQCTYTTGSLYVRTVLYRHDWWGLNSMATSEKTKLNYTWVEVTPHSSCDSAPTRTYSGYSSHTATIAGVAYSASTSNTKSFACN